MRMRQPRVSPSDERLARRKSFIYYLFTVAVTDRRDEMTNATYQQIATDWTLWTEQMDTGAEMTREEFDAMTTDEKVALLVDAFGAE